MRSTTRAKKKCIFELNIEAQSISNLAQLDCSGGGDLQGCGGDGGDGGGD